MNSSTSPYDRLVVNNVRLLGQRLMSRIRRRLPLALVLLSLTIVSASARSTSLTSADLNPATPIQIVNTNAGRVMTTHAERYDDRIYVAGLVHRPFSNGMGAHVHVWGVDKNHHRVFFKTTGVLVTGRPSFIRSEPYVVSFSPSEFAQAKTVYVTFHGQGHADSAGEN